MIGNVSPAAVDTKTAPPDFWSRYHAYRRLRHAETRPDNPVKPDDLVEISMKREDPFEFEHRYEIARAGRMAAGVPRSEPAPSANTPRREIRGVISIPHDATRTCGRATYR